MKNITLKLSYPFLYLIHLLKEKKLIRIGMIDISRIGHMTSPFVCYLIRKRYQNRKTFDLIFSTKKIANFFLYKKLYNKFFLIRFEKIFYYLNSAYKYYFKKPLNDINTEITALRNINEFNNLVNFTSSEEEIVFNILNELGLRRNDKWICIHNRDNKYLNKYFPNINWNYHNHRDFHPDSFNASIKQMINNGYYVFRMGNITKDPINLTYKKLIDFSNLKTNHKELLEIYLLSKASFYFGSDSGIFTVSMISNRPFSFINFPSITSMFKYYHWSSLPYIFKIRKNLKTNKLLTLSEIFKQNLDDMHHSEHFKKKSIQLVDNTQDEINDLCSEVMQRLESNYHQTKDQINLQKKFNEICLNFISLEKNIKRYPIVGTKFLAKYSDLII